MCAFCASVCLCLFLVVFDGSGVWGGFFHEPASPAQCGPGTLESQDEESTGKASTEGSEELEGAELQPSRREAWGANRPCSHIFWFPSSSSTNQSGQEPDW